MFNAAPAVKQNIYSATESWS